MIVDKKNFIVIYLLDEIFLAIYQFYYFHILNIIQYFFF